MDPDGVADDAFSADAADEDACSVASAELELGEPESLEPLPPEFDGPSPEGLSVVGSGVGVVVGSDVGGGLVVGSEVGGFEVGVVGGLDVGVVGGFEVGVVGGFEVGVVGGFDEGLVGGFDDGLVGGLEDGLVVDPPPAVLLSSGVMWLRSGPWVTPSTEPRTRVAWNICDQRTLVSRTSRPVRGASTIMPLPAYMATW